MNESVSHFYHVIIYDLFFKQQGTICSACPLGKFDLATLLQERSRLICFQRIQSIFREVLPRAREEYSFLSNVPAGAYYIGDLSIFIKCSTAYKLPGFPSYSASVLLSLHACLVSLILDVYAGRTLKKKEVESPDCSHCSHPLPRIPQFSQANQLAKQEKHSDRSPGV